MLRTIWRVVSVACLSALLGAVASAWGAAGHEPPEISGNEALDAWIRALAPLEDSLVAGIGSGVDLDRVLGPNPFLIAPAPAPSERAWVVLLRGSDEIALLDDRFEVTHRLPAPPGPSSWTWIDSSLVVVGGAESGVLALYRVAPDLQELARMEIAATGVRGVAFDAESRTGFALDPIDDRALAFRVEHGAEQSAMAADRSGVPPGWRLSRRPELDLSLPAGPLHAACIDGLLITNSLLAHTITVHRRTLDGWADDASVTLDGPIWAMDVASRGDTVWIAAGGIEDRPLDRTAGEFGNVDSNLYLYRYLTEASDNERIGHREAEARDRHAATLERVAEWNVSELGVITPKRVLFEGGAIWVSGYGGERIVRLRVRERSAPATLSLPCPPGISDFAVDRTGSRLVAVSPLLDMIAELPLPERTDPDEPAAYALTSLRSTPDSLGSTPASSSLRSTRVPALPAAHAQAELELGELLVFTTLLTPENRAEGDLSRFTCEACHFEGGVDGRTHFTGREHVFATTKPIRGLAQNVPLFSRAGSELLCDMVPAEFAVANQNRSDRHWITAEDHPWLRAMPSLPEKISPEMQRRGMLRYLFELPVIPNPCRSADWTPLEEEGLRVFRDRCANCHLPVRTTRDERSRVAFERWDESLSSAGSDLIWGAPFLMKTGITPYVSPAGARVPSLRRVAWKRPYFTDGSARTIDDVLDRFRYGHGAAWHRLPNDRDEDAAELGARTVAAESRENGPMAEQRADEPAESPRTETGTRRLEPAEKAALRALLRRF